MKCEQCTSLPEPVEDSLPTSFLDIPPWLQSNGNHTPAKCLENEQQKDGFPNCECGKGMCDCLIHPNTPDRWIASMRDSLAKILVSLENKPVLGKEPDRGFTEKSCVLLAQLDQDTYSWKMSPLLKATVLNKLSKTWPSWGMTVDGCAYEHPMSGHRITGTGGFYFPTPVSSDGTTGDIIGKNDTFMETKNGMLRKYNQNGTNGSIGLARYVKFWPTPTAHNAKETNAPSEHTRNTPTLTAQVNWPTPRTKGMCGGSGAWALLKKNTTIEEARLMGAGNGGKLNPTWVEWLMGWPLGWTNLKQSEMVKSRSKSQQRLPSWLRSK